jgi:hypothetical protein
MLGLPAIRMAAGATVEGRIPPPPPGMHTRPSRPASLGPVPPCQQQLGGFAAGLGPRAWQLSAVLATSAAAPALIPAPASVAAPVTPHHDLRNAAPGDRHPSLVE